MHKTKNALITIYESAFMLSEFQFITERIKRSKISLIICCAFFVVGIIFSLFYTLPEEGLFSQCTTIFDVVTSTVSPKYFITRLICEYLIIIVGFLFGLSIYTLPLIFPVICYRGFLMGITVKALIPVYSIGGVAVGLFVVIPSGIISFFALCCICALSCDALNGRRVVCKNNIEKLIFNLVFCLIIASISVVYILIVQLIVLNPLNYKI